MHLYPVTAYFYYTVANNYYNNIGGVLLQGSGLVSTLSPDHTGLECYYYKLQMTFVVVCYRPHVYYGTSLAGPPLRNKEGSGIIPLHELCNRKLIFKHRLRNLTTDAKPYEGVNKYSCRLKMASCRALFCLGCRGDLSSRAGDLRVLTSSASRKILPVWKDVTQKRKEIGKTFNIEAEPFNIEAEPFNIEAEPLRQPERTQPPQPTAAHPL